MDATRTVGIWLGNDEGMYYAALEAARDDGPEDAIRELVHEIIGLDHLDGLALDLMTDALEAVDWAELAADFAPAGFVHRRDDG
jgi:hypothetical protein